MNNIQQIYDTLHKQQKDLLDMVNSYHSRNEPSFQIDALATQVSYMGNAIALILKALGAKTHE